MNPIDLVKRRGATGALIGAVAMTLAGCAARYPESAAQDLASAPPCPNGETASDKPAASASLPLGCNNQANLRAMVADAKDLDQGRPLEPASGAQEVRAIEAYKKGTVRRLSTENETGTTSSAAPLTPQGER